MSVRNLPYSGYLLERVYATEQRLETRPPRSDDAVGGAITFAWDWEIRGPEMFEVRISLGYDPTPERLESLRVSLVGRFVPQSPLPSVERDKFVELQAPAILMPYVRQIVTMLTAQGFYGPYYLPPVNIVRLMQEQDKESATGRRQQLASGEHAAVAGAGAPGSRLVEPAADSSAGASDAAPAEEDRAQARDAAVASVRRAAGRRRKPPAEPTPPSDETR